MDDETALVCIMQIAAYARREGATKHSVRAAMERDGWTKEEILEALALLATPEKEG